MSGAWYRRERNLALAELESACDRLEKILVADPTLLMKAEGKALAHAHRATMILNGLDTADGTPL